MDSNRSASSNGSGGKSRYFANDHVAMLSQPSTTSVGETMHHYAHMQQHSDLTGLSTTYVVNPFTHTNTLPKTPRNRERRAKSSYYGRPK